MNWKSLLTALFDGFLVGLAKAPAGGSRADFLKSGGMGALVSMAQVISEAHTTIPSQVPLTTSPPIPNQGVK